MARFPDEFYDIARAIVEQHKEEDAEVQVELAIEQIVGLDSYKGFADSLAREAIGGLIYDERYERNKATKFQSGEYFAPVRVPATSRIVNEISQYYNYSIEGRRLGKITGNEIPDIIRRETAKSNGHLFNVNLLKKLEPIVKGEKSVEDIVSKDDLEKYFKESNKKTYEKKGNKKHATVGK